MDSTVNWLYEHSVSDHREQETTEQVEQNQSSAVWQ